MRTGDTIIALSSGALPAAIAVMRVSGPAAKDALVALAGALPQPRRASYRRLRDGSGATLDHALVLWLPGPNTATGEDVAELHLHGSRAVAAAVTAALQDLPGLRLAVAGEFTRRALINGRIDLSQTEGLADLLNADTEAQRRAAIRSVEGGVGRAVEHWLNRLTDISAMVEAELDYGDEIDADVPGSFRPLLCSLREEIAIAMARPAVERLRDGVCIVLAGPPNAGKSSLINALCGREVAITATVAGTTRDIVEATVIRSGRAYILSDTAGLNDASDDPIERIGIARAHDAIAAADLVLWLGDDAPPEQALWLLPRAAIRFDQLAGDRFAVSTEWPESIDDLWTRLEEETKKLQPEDVQLFNQRERGKLGVALTVLTSAEHETDVLLVAEYLRHARMSLRQAVGYDETDLVLDALFERFCIGK